MEEITLTGATLAADEATHTAVPSPHPQHHPHPHAPHSPAAGAVELTTRTTTAHSHSHSHSHHHQQQQQKPCCSNHNTATTNNNTTTAMNLIPSKASIQQLVTTTPLPELFQALSAVIRMSPFPVWEAILQDGLLLLLPVDQQQEERQEEETTSTTASRTRSVTRMQVLSMQGPDGHSLLHWAAKRVDDIRFLQSLLQHVPPELVHTPSKDAVGMCPIHWACTEGSIPHVSLLLLPHKSSSSTTTTTTSRSLEARDASGCTPLLIAAQYGHVHVVAYLLQHGADRWARDTSQDSALHWAAYKGSMEVCGLLGYHSLAFRTRAASLQQQQQQQWNATDVYGQTPLHLASLRGHTPVVRYILQQVSSPSERRALLTLKDTNHKTALDLAVSKKRPTVEAVLREAMESPSRRTLWRKLQWGVRTFCSWHSWKLWMGCHTAQDEADESPKFPLYFVVVTMAMGALFYPFVYLPITNTSEGVLWDCMGWHLSMLVCHSVMWWSLYKTYMTNPGTLDDGHPKTMVLRRLYEETLESYSDAEKVAKNETPLCHTCHVARPLRSKHCRIARRCVLMFDHHCPFVGATVGLENYKWFYLFLLSLTLTEIGFIATLSLHLSRQTAIPWSTLIVGVYVAFFIIPAAGMLIYHTQLTLVNLTTNEHQNLSRYNYLQNERGQYSNPFFRGFFGNVVDRFSPSEASYTLRHVSGGREYRSLSHSSGDTNGNLV